MCRSADLIARDPGFISKLSIGSSSLEDIKAIVTCMGKAVINIGDGLTLLHVASQFGQEDALRYLVEEKYHPLEVKTINGETPLDQAAWRGHTDVAMALIRYGANIDCVTNHKYTPLHRCAFYNHHRLAALLCLNGANQDAVDGDGKTAYDVAVERGHEKIARLLKPIVAEDGTNVSGSLFASNNPSSADYRPEARAALFGLPPLPTREAAGEEDDEAPPASILALSGLGGFRLAPPRTDDSSSADHVSN